MSLDRYFLPVSRQSAETESRQLQPSCSPTEQNDSSFSAEPDNSGCSVSVSEQPEDLGTIDSKPAQPSLGIYAPKQFGSTTRDFKKTWFFNREWLEFSISRKAAFCYCCRNFGGNAYDPHFTTLGYSNWKHALEKNKGFDKHVHSNKHVWAMTAWKENKKRKSRNEEVSTLVSQNRLEKNRYYMASIIDVVQFLCLNELAFRGDGKSGLNTLYDDDENEPSGLFLRLFEYTLKKDEKLRTIYKSIPKNASYTSARFQNELIEILKSVIVKTMVDDVKSADIPVFTIKVDGTRDKTNIENISVVIRYVKNGKVSEILLDLPKTSKFDAASILKVMLKSLQDCGLEAKQIFSQCYDGASVMAGKYGGVQKLLQEKLEKDIPYIHCLNHQLHLVVIHAIGENDEVRKALNVCKTLYKFLQRPILSQFYEGTKLKRLLEQRWSGHLTTITAVINNHQHLIELMDSCDERVPDSDTCVEAAGLLKIIRQKKFMFILHAVQQILLILKPADQQLQERETDILTGIQLMTSIIQVLKGMREDAENTFENINDATLLLDLEDSTTRRHCVAPRLLEDYVTQSSTGHRDLSPQSKLKGIMYEIIDSCVAELQTRFSERNITYVKSMLSLWPLNENFLAFESISPLANLMQFSANEMEALQNETLVAKPFLLEHFNRETHKCLGDICTFMHAYKTAFPKVYTLLVGGATFGASTVTCEA